MRADGWAIVQLPEGGNVEIDLDKALRSSGNREGAARKEKWRAWWIDPRIGGREVFRVGEDYGIKAFEAPSKGEGDNDWLLLLETYSP